MSKMSGRSREKEGSLGRGYMDGIVKYLIIEIYVPFLNFCHIKHVITATILTSMPPCCNSIEINRPCVKVPGPLGEIYMGNVHTKDTSYRTLIISRTCSLQV